MLASTRHPDRAAPLEATVTAAAAAAWSAGGRARPSSNMGLTSAIRSASGAMARPASCGRALAMER